MNLDQVTYKKLQPGVHIMTIKAWTIKEDRNKQSFVQVTFAPSNNLAHEHHVALYANEQNNFLRTFISNVKELFPGLDESTDREVLDFSINTEMPCSLVANTVSTPQGRRTYYNWYLGYEAPQATTTSVASEEVDF